MTPDQQHTYDTGLAEENALLQTLLELGFSQNRAVTMIGLAKASLHYRSKPRGRVSDPVPHRDRPHPAALSRSERDVVAGVLRGSSLSVAETFYAHIDSGQYLASMSTFHRIAREEKITMAATGLKKKRTGTTTESAAAPVLCATAPGQVLCWDISFLPGRYRGVSFALYLIIDLHSRMICGWTIQTSENQFRAAELMNAVLTDAAGSVTTVHSDNGAAMTSKLMKKTLTTDHHVNQSLIRPGVSNDNAQIESLFRTVKYGPAWPGAFDDIDHANHWFTEFVHAYNNTHHHSSLAGFTPAQVHHGNWLDVAQQRQATLDTAYAQHPERFRNRPQVPTPPQQVTLNLGHNHGKNHTPPTLLELLAG